MISWVGLLQGASQYRQHLLDSDRTTLPASSSASCGEICARFSMRCAARKCRQETTLQSGSRYKFHGSVSPTANAFGNIAFLCARSRLQPLQTRAGPVCRNSSYCGCSFTTRPPHTGADPDRRRHPLLKPRTGMSGLDAKEGETTLQDRRVVVRGPALRPHVIVTSQPLAHSQPRTSSSTMATSPPYCPISVSSSGRKPLHKNSLVISTRALPDDAARHLLLSAKKNHSISYKIPLKPH